MIEEDSQVRFVHWIDGTTVRYDHEMAGAIGVVLDVIYDPETGKYEYNVDFGAEFNAPQGYVICRQGEIVEVVQ